MSTKRLLAGFFLLFLLWFFSCLSQEKRERQALKEEEGPALNPHGQTILIALDSSQSMRISDPDRFSVEGTHLAAAISDLGTNLGVIPFKSNARVLVPLGPLNTIQDKDLFLQRLSGLKFSGKTNFLSALTLIYTELQKARAPAGSVVLFLTDGRPDLGNRIADEMNEKRSIEYAKKFKSAGYRIYTIALGSRVNMEFLNTLSAETGAPPTFHVAREDGGEAYASAKELLSVFVKITGAVHDLFEFCEGIEPLEIFPGTKKLLFTMVKKSPEATFDHVTLDGKEVPREGYFRYPSGTTWNSRCEVLFIDRPMPGIWDVHPRGELEVGIVLEELPLTLTCHPLEYETYTEGTPVRFRYSAHFQDPQWAAILKARAKVWVDILSSEGRKSVINNYPLEPKEENAGSFVFEGAPIPFLSEPSEEEILLAQVHFRLNRRGGKGSSRTSTMDFRLKPGKGPGMLLSPEQLDFGYHWTDGNEAVRSLRIENRSPRPLQVEATCPEGFHVFQPVVEIPPRESRDLQVAFHPHEATAVGKVESKIELATRNSSEGKERVFTVPLRYRRFSFHGKPETDMGRLFLLKEGETPFAFSIPRIVSPEETEGFRYRLDEPEGEAGQAWTLAQKPSGFEIASTFSPSSAPGTYRATLRVSREDGSLPERAMDFHMELHGIPRLAIQGNPRKEIIGFGPREIAFNLDLFLEYPSEGKFNVSLEKNRWIAGEEGQAVEPNDYEIEFLSGWDGQEIVPGAHYSLQLNAYISSDLCPGTYRGSVKLNLQGSDYPDHWVDIPLEVAVKR